MKKLWILTLMLGASFGGVSAATQPVIPKPAEYTLQEGTFKVPQTWKVYSCLPTDASEKILASLNHPFELVKTGANLTLKENSEIGPEGYSLNVTPSGVTIEASVEKGFFYALQSLYQLSKLQGEGTEIAACTINDFPRFEYRSLMLDATRYFIPKEEVLKLIDLAAALKFNNLHIHLCDDNGWRMEIKKYPKLTETGAWRIDSQEIFPGRLNATSADQPTPIGGFYTQDDLREIVAYAADRYINVVPEIEMPAHAAAAIASYPELACPVVDKFVGVFPGIGGPDASIIMCGGNDKVYDFYCDVLDEVMDIFPSKYIHLGGDEADKSIWKQCDLCNARIQELGLDGYEGLQGYFMDRINRYVISKGRTAMGWDEVTYGDPKEDMVILGWQGLGNVAVNYAKKTGRKFVMTPAKVLYLLRYQGPQWFEPFTYFGNNTLKDVYEYEAVQADWTPELKNQLLGIQGSIWTEFCNSPEDVEYLLFPRLVAVADAAWRQEGTQDWPMFIDALDMYTPELDRRGIVHAPSMYNIQHKVTPDGNGGLLVNLACERPDMDIQYQRKGMDYDLQPYNGAIAVNSPVAINANTYKNGEEMGKNLGLILNFNKATGKKVSSPNCNNDLQYALTNGLRGSDRISDFEWAGWHNRDAEFVVDLGEVMPVNYVKLGTIGFSHICVAMPESVTLYGSEDGENFTELASETIDPTIVFAKRATKHDIHLKNIDTNSRYLKVVAKNPGPVPDGFARAGTVSWLYFDEISVN